MPIYDLHHQPDLDRPVLLVVLEGWIDAGGAAAHALEVLRTQLDERPVATFDADALLDFRARRPTMHLIDGVNTGLTWASTQLSAATAPGGQDLLLLTGAEPDHAWGAFTTAVRELALAFGARMLVGLGAYPAGAPHTRPVVLSATASTEALAAEVGFLRGTIEVPAGIEAALERDFDAVGLPAVGIWAQVPHYAAGMRYPAAASALITGLNQVAGCDFGLGDLPAESARTRSRIDALIEGNPEHVAMIRQLEAQADALTAETMQNLPSGDDLAEELQRFLREQGDTGL